MNGKITCCRYCVAPKRHIGCHETCPEYLEQKDALVKYKKKERELKALEVYDYDKMAYRKRYCTRRSKLR